ncbi:MAG: hypothetical protein ACT4QD_24655 [Acidobacteriota bacterium]
MTHLTDRGPGGRHEIKAGVEYESTSGRQEQRYPQDSNYYDNFGEPQELDIWAGFSGSATTSRWSRTCRTPGP